MRFMLWFAGAVALIQQCVVTQETHKPLGMLAVYQMGSLMLSGLSPDPATVGVLSSLPFLP
jgi:hypothetical protein